MSKIEIEVTYPIQIKITEPTDQLITWQEALRRVADGLPVEAQAGKPRWQDVRTLSLSTLADSGRWIGYSFRIPPTTVKLSIS